jgi:hypothetical protein
MKGFGKYGKRVGRKTESVDPKLQEERDHSYELYMKSIANKVNMQ